MAMLNNQRVIHDKLMANIKEKSVETHIPGRKLYPVSLDWFPNHGFHEQSNTVGGG